MKMLCEALQSQLSHFLNPGLAAWWCDGSTVASQHQGPAFKDMTFALYMNWKDCHGNECISISIQNFSWTDVICIGWLDYIK